MKVYDFIKTFTFDDLNEDLEVYVTDLIKKGKKKDMGIGFGKHIFINWFYQNFRMEIYIIGVILVVIST